MQRDANQLQIDTIEPSKRSRRSPLWLALLVLLGTGLLACQSDNGVIQFFHPVTVAEIQHLSKEGVPADTIIAKMKASGTIYHVNDTQKKSFLAQGISPKVVDYMIQTYEEAIKEHPWLKKDPNFTCWFMGYDGIWYGPHTKPFSNCGY